jgi:hypothetical protein
MRIASTLVLTPNALSTATRCNFHCPVADLKLHAICLLSFLRQCIPGFHAAFWGAPRPFPERAPIVSYSGREAAGKLDLETEIFKFAIGSENRSDLTGVAKRRSVVLLVIEVSTMTGIRAAIPALKRSVRSTSVSGPHRNRRFRPMISSREYPVRSIKA